MSELEEKHSEMESSTEESSTKMIKVFIDQELYEKFMEIQKVYRSPSITHTIRLMIEDRWMEQNTLPGGRNKGK